MAARSPETRTGSLSTWPDRPSRLKRIFLNPGVKIACIMFAGHLLIDRVIEPTIQDPPSYVRIVSNPLGQFIDNSWYGLRKATAKAIDPGDRPQ
jgi:hypothetical protein